MAMKGYWNGWDYTATENLGNSGKIYIWVVRLVDLIAMKKTWRHHTGITYDILDPWILLHRGRSHRNITVAFACHSLYLLPTIYNISTTYLQLTTYLPTTYYLLPITAICHLLPTAYYCHLPPTTCCILHSYYLQLTTFLPHDRAT